MARRGRKPKPDAKICKYYRIDPKTLDLLEYAAQELQISRSELVRRAVRQFIEGLKKEGIQIPL